MIANLINGTDVQTITAQKHANAFMHQTFGTPEAFGNKLSEFVAANLGVNGVITRSDYDLFCHQILSQIRNDMELTGLILTKFEAQYE